MRDDSDQKTFWFPGEFLQPPKPQNLFSSQTLIFVGRWTERHDPTIEDAYRFSVRLHNQPVFWDIIDPGDQDFGPINSMYIRSGQCFLILYSITSRSDFLRVETDVEFLRHLLDTEQGDQRDPPILICGSKFDLGTERVVSREEGLALAQKLGVMWTETSSKTGLNAKLAIEVLVELTLTQQGIHERKLLV